MMPAVIFLFIMIVMVLKVQKMVSFTKTQLSQIISEAIAAELRRKSTLNESQESESIKGATFLYMKRTGKSKEEADKFIRIDLRATFPPLRDKKIGKFILGVTRMYLDGQLRDATTIANLNSTLKYVGDPTHINEYDRNLNGMSAQDLIERFAPARMQDMEKDKAELSKTQYRENSAYKIVRIDSFEQARQYGKYNDWCLAQPNGKDMFDSYTSDGVNQLYIILRDGFENELRTVGPNAPYDSYGLSMMTVIVDPYGQMTQSTTRWNHANGSSDSAFTPKTMSEVIGRNFYEVFKPNTKFRDALENAHNRLRNGEDPIRIFDEIGEEYEGMRYVELMNKMNYLTKDNRILMSQWVDYANDFHEGFGNIFIKGKGNNFINTKGELLSKTWFDGVGDFHDGFAIVYVEGKGDNFINANGEFLSRTWFNGASNFHEGFALVKMIGKGRNYINTKGEFLSETWFDEASDFHDGFALVYVQGKGWNYINAKGEIISKTWFDGAYRFHDGFATINVKGKGYNFINANGELLSETWFDSVGDFHEGFGLIFIKGKGWNYINTKGEFLSKMWFDNGDVFHNRFARVYVKGKGWNYINAKGELISKTWFDGASTFNNTGFGAIKKGEKLYYIDRNGNVYGRRDFEEGKKNPVTLNEETLKEIVRKVLMETIDKSMLKTLMKKKK